jgi:hypothetical protein
MEIYLSNLIASATPSDYTIFLQFRPTTEAIFDSTNTYPLYYKAYYYYYLSNNTDTLISKPRIYISQDIVGSSTIYRFYLDLGIYIAENNIYSGSFPTGQSYVKVNGRLGFNYTGSFYYTYNGGVYKEITANRLLHSGNYDAILPYAKKVNTVQFYKIPGHGRLNSWCLLGNYTLDVENNGGIWRS